MDRQFTSRAVGLFSRRLALSALLFSFCLGLEKAAPALDSTTNQLINRGDYFKQRGALNEACNYYLQAEQHEPGDAKPHRRLGEIYGAMKRYDEGLGEINKALKISDEDHKLYVDRGLCYVGLHKPALAQADFEKAITRPTCGTAVYGYLQNIYRDQGKIDKAISICDLHLTREPAFYQIYEHKARLYMAKKDYASARATLDKVIKIVPYNFLHYELRGDVNMLDGKTEAAIADYSKALDLEPFFPAQIYASRAKAYSRLGNKALADKDIASSKVRD